MTEKSGSTKDERRNTMSKVADLKNALTELFRKGTEVGYGQDHNIPSLVHLIQFHWMAV